MPVKNMSKNDVSKLLKTIQYGLQHCSIQELSENIKNSVIVKDDRKEDALKVIKIVALHYGVSIESILKGKKRGVVTDAKRMCFCLIHNELNFTISYIADKIWDKIHYYTVQSAINFYKEINEQIKHEKEFKEVYSKIKTKIDTEIKARRYENI